MDQVNAAPWGDACPRRAFELHPERVPYIQRLKEQLGVLTDVVRGKVDAQQFAALETRVAKLEARLGL